MLWRRDELKRLFGIDADADGVSIDTRTLREKDLFVGLLGDNGVDGMRFAQDAMDRGAAGVIGGLDGLLKLAMAGRDRCKARRIAITGSVGKTTTKELMATALHPFGATHAAVASYNNHWGVPLTLARMPRESVYGVFEIGMNHRGEIAPLTHLVKPDVALISTVAPVHLEHLGSLENIAREKADIFDGLATEGTAVIPADAPHADILFDKAKQMGCSILTFGAGRADVILDRVDVHPEGVHFTAIVAGAYHQGFIPLGGSHTAMNAMAVLAAIYAFGLDIPKALDALRQYEPLAGRGQRFTAGDGITVFDESYNASPEAVKATLKTMAAFPCAGRRVAILGDMFELGEHSAALHAGLADTIRELPIHHVITCGDAMRHLHEVLPDAQRGQHYPDAATVAENLHHLILAKDCVLIKGSLGMKMKVVIEAIRNI